MIDSIRTGLDLVHIPRITRMAENYGERFYSLAYTPQERAYCLAQPVMQSRRLAGRWAAKEAIVKALGTGWRNVGYRDAEVIAEPGHAPQVQLHGAALALGGTWRWALSISHDGEYAIACASALPVPQETPLPGGLSNEFEEYSHYLARLCGEYLLLHTQTQNPQLPEAERATAQLKLLPNLLGLQKTLTQVLVAQP